MIVADHAGHPLFAGGRPAGIQGAAPALLAVCRHVVAYFSSAELTKRWFYRERGMRLQR